MSAACLAGAEFEFQPSVVGTNAYRSVETSCFRPDTSFPHEIVICVDAHFRAIHLGAKCVGGPGTQDGHGRTMDGLDVTIAAVSAFRAGVLAGITLYGDDELGFGFNAPHRVNEIARILGAELEAKLATHL